jgi:hypothetical protein
LRLQLRLKARYYQVKYNKILLSRAYVDMANRMKKISILATELCRYEASKKAYSSKVADAPYAVKKFKKSVADLVTQKRVLRAARQEDAAAKLGDILQLTIVEAVNLDMLDRFTKVDASCVAVLTDAEGRLASCPLLPPTDCMSGRRLTAQGLVPCECGCRRADQQSKTVDRHRLRPARPALAGAVRGAAPARLHPCHPGLFQRCSISRERAAAC